jgi:glycosyltransferase involved in cell wall biosynthesis
VLAETVAELRGQTRPADRLVVCGAVAEDVAGIDPACVILTPRGLSVQRNAVLVAVADCDVVVFFDDDFLPAPGWLAAVEAVFAEHADVVAATGHVIADGIKGPGLSAAAGRALLRGDGGPSGERLATVYNAYGCNMALRMAPLRAHGLRFDEALPLYAWYEDIDLCRRLAPHGRIVRVPGARGVHLGTKLGRTSGVRLGYSQMANPVYLARKGSFAWGRAVGSMARNLAANLGRWMVPEPWVDRRGRLRGNLLALADVCRGRVDPGRILSL